MIIQALILGLSGRSPAIALGWGMVKRHRGPAAQLGTPMTGYGYTDPNDMRLSDLWSAYRGRGDRRCAAGSQSPHWHPPIQAMNETVNPEPSPRVPSPAASSRWDRRALMDTVLAYRRGRWQGSDIHCRGDQKRLMRSAPRWMSASARHAWSSA